MQQQRLPPLFRFFRGSSLVIQDQIQRGGCRIKEGLDLLTPKQLDYIHPSVRSHNQYNTTFPPGIFIIYVLFFSLLLNDPDLIYLVGEILCLLAIDGADQISLPHLLCRLAARIHSADLNFDRKRLGILLN